MEDVEVGLAVVELGWDGGCKNDEVMAAGRI